MGILDQAKLNDIASELNNNAKAEEEMINLREADPMVIMRAAAEGMGIILNDPKPNCKKCYGRGYLGRKSDTGEPLPCTCIFPKYDRELGNVPLAYTPVNRAERRAQKKKSKTKHVESVDMSLVSEREENA